ncbi:hypothetical protein [Amycolatopsis sp. PS_44_ISF1]|uniref:hypothetical protein n=1 Tax=Amycolatopsis sp. PS_44_ISF1 TaxID=2974917 RepID=UPI0028DDD379|nr:hypothetical protein [Amycolatopsis sp. PS_44_ISF1]MDT8911655.1 hypothetical protein [Amycolatopsis sp. PS_44_ISF1]
MSAGKAPHELAASVPPGRLAEALVRELALAVDGQVTHRQDGRVVTKWPRAGDYPGEVAREPVAGGGSLHVAGPRRWGDRERAALWETASWLAIAVRTGRLRGERDEAEARAAALRVGVRTARARLVRVRELERRRLVRAITATTLRDLDEVRTRLVAASDPPLDRELARVNDALDELLENFRGVARGVYPALLPDRGPRAALEELAATLPRPVRFRGDLGRRVEWQLESGLYHAVAAVLNVVAGARGGADVVTVELRRDNALRARIATATQWSTEWLRDALEHDAERVVLFGGTMRCEVRDGHAEVEVRVAERLEPGHTERPLPRYEGNFAYTRVWELVQEGRRATADGPDRPLWDAVAVRLAQPPRLAVIDAAGAAKPGLARAGVLAVTVLDVDPPADAALAREFLADEGPRGSVDAVLCPGSPPPEFRDALRQGRQRVELSESADPTELVGKLVNWGPVIATRRALVTARELVPRLPEGHPLRWSFERFGVETHALAELDLLDELQRRGSPLLRGAAPEVFAAATRLLGALGPDPCSRLGLASDAGEHQVRAAAEQAHWWWRSRAEQPATGGRDRAACEVLIRTAEELLSPGGDP